MRLAHTVEQYTNNNTPVHQYTVIRDINRQTNDTIMIISLSSLDIK